MATKKKTTAKKSPKPQPKQQLHSWRVTRANDSFDVVAEGVHAGDGALTFWDDDDTVRILAPGTWISVDRIDNDELDARGDLPLQR